MARQPKTQAEAEAMLTAANELLKMRETAGWKILMAELWRQRRDAVRELIDIDVMNTIRLEELQKEIKMYQWFFDTADQLIRQGLQIEEAEEAGDEGDYDDGRGNS